MANTALKCQLLKHGLFSAKTLRNLDYDFSQFVFFHLKGATAIHLRRYGSDRCNCDCPQRESTKKDPRDTEEECEYYKKLMAKKHVENTCQINEWTCHRYDTTVCDPMECKVEKIEERPPIPEEVFEQDPPCIPYEGEGKDFTNMCEVAQLRRCYAEDPMKAHRCRSDKPVCFSWDKTYPMRDAGLKPEIDGRPIVGEFWKKKSWGFKKC